MSMNRCNIVGVSYFKFFVVYDDFVGFEKYLGRSVAKGKTVLP